MGEGHSRIGTGDGEFRADSGDLVAFVSVAKFGGSDSLPIRLSKGISGAQFLVEELLLFGVLVLVKHRLPSAFERFTEHA